MPKPLDPKAAERAVTLVGYDCTAPRAPEAPAARAPSLACEHACSLSLAVNAVVDARLLSTLAGLALSTSMQSEL